MDEDDHMRDAEPDLTSMEIRCRDSSSADVEVWADDSAGPDPAGQPEPAPAEPTDSSAAVETLAAGA